LCDPIYSPIYQADLPLCSETPFKICNEQTVNNWDPLLRQTVQSIFSSRDALYNRLSGAALCHVPADGEAGQLFTGEALAKTNTAKLDSKQDR
jgi:hypothetical protein